MTAPRIAVSADDRKAGMTLDELTRFVVGARTNGTPGDTPIYGTLGWKQQVQQLETRPDKAPRSATHGRPA